MSTDSKSLETVPSAEATYTDQKTFGVIAGRSHVEISPKYGGEFRAGDVIRLEIPAQAYLDPNEFYIHFRTKLFAGTENTDNPHRVANVTTPNVLPYQSAARLSSGQDNKRLKTLQFPPGIQVIFNRVRLLAGSVVLEDIQDYNVLYRMLLESTTSLNWRETDGFMNEGVYDPENFNQRMANANFHSDFGVTIPNPGHVYCIKPLFGLFAAGKYIPLKYMGQLTIELYLENDKECLWSSSSTPENYSATAARSSWLPVSLNPGTVDRTTVNGYGRATGLHSGFVSDVIFQNSTDFPNGSYSVSDVRMHVPFVHPIESFDQAMMRQIESGDVAIYHASWSTHSRQIPSTTKQSLSFQERALSLKGALACMRNSPDIRAIDADFSFPANGITAYQWKIGSEYIPAQPIECDGGGGRAMAELRKGLGSYNDPSALNCLAERNFLPVDLPHQLDTLDRTELLRGVSQPSSFMMALDLEKSPGQASGFDSAASSVDIELILNLRNHAEKVGITSATYSATTPSARFGKAIDSATWQPSKKRIHFTKMGGSAVPTVDDHVYRSYEGDSYLLPFVTDPFGIMQDKNVTYISPPQVIPAGTSLLLPPTYADNGKNNYARVYLFAHIDQVLRLSAVGRMEIVR
jgi:hypothetical protein